MKYNFQKTGIKIFLVSVALLVLMTMFDLSFYFRLFIGTFLIGTAVFLIASGNLKPPEDDEE